MELHNRFDVPVPPATAFRVLRDIERIGPCMPGATIEDVEGDHFKGRVKVKIGPIQVTYRGEADYQDVDEAAMTATIKARGREARGAGTADATVRAQVTDGPDGGATVDVTTELAITGKPAQFGRGVMADVAEKLIGSFADCLSTTLAEGDEDEAAADDAAADDAVATTAVDAGSAASNGTGGDATAAPASPPSAAPATGAATPPPPTTAPPKPAAKKTSAKTPVKEAEAINLLEVAGAPVAQRLAPIAGGLVILFVIWRLLRRRG